MQVQVTTSTFSFLELYLEFCLLKDFFPSEPNPQDILYFTKIKWKKTQDEISCNKWSFTVNLRHITLDKVYRKNE